MAKNITLLGANYPNVPAVQLPQTGGGVATFYDTSDHNFGTAVELTGTNYECPSDGYLRVDLPSNAAASTYIYGYINNEIMVAITHNSGGNLFGLGRNSVFVRKGMNLKIATDGGTGYFIPLVT